ncbi:MAG: protein kinase, partial [Gemmatimonadales bacterium]
MSKITSQLSAALADRYKIESHLGEGGMATVYLAHDIKHDRKVALKVLRPELAAVIGAERFLQEIKVTANLQHPHILPLHDSGDAGAFLYYVMPYVEGDSLRDKLNRERQFAIDEAVEITRSIAGALDYAHRQGVIHRDIKPENILLHDGQAMVADFGIALAVSQASGARLTETGLSIGTPHYMSPEQAMGDRQLDARSDVYSLGAMLFEMLAGDPPYTGSTAQAVVAKVITEKAPLVTAARDTVPENIAAAISKALNKMPADRFASAAAFADALTDPAFTIPGVAASTAEEAPAVAPSRRATTLAGTAAGAAVIAAFIVGRAFAPDPPLRLTRFTVGPPDSVSRIVGRCCGRAIAMSPDGSQLVFLTSPSTAPIARRDLERLAVESMQGTDGASIPFFSPDGRWLGFHKDGQLRKAPMGGGPSIPIADVARAEGASWGDNDVIVVGSSSSGLYTVPAAGGELVQATTPDSGTNHQWPHMLPGGRAALFAVFGGGQDMTRIAVADLETGEIDTIGFGSHAEYGSGYLVHGGPDGTLLAQPFDPRARRTTGPAVALLEGVRTSGPGFPEFAISDNGALVYYLAASAGVIGQTLEIVTATGRLPVALPEVGNLEDPAFSPDGRRITLRFSDLGATQDIRVFDLDQGTLDRLTVEGERNLAPVWTKDGRRIAFATDRAGPPNIYWKPFDGSGPAERILETSYAAFPASWLPDGRTLVFNASRGEDTGWDIGLVTVGDSTPTWVLASEFNERHAQVSPDGRWLAYTSNLTGEPEVYVQALSGEGARYRISTRGGSSPRWSPDGETLYYVSDATLIAASLQTEPEVRVTERVERFSGVNDLNLQNVTYDVHPNGEDFLIINTGGGASGAQIVWILDWLEIAREMEGGR